MVNKNDFVRLRCKIYCHFKKWFSYSQKHKVLYCDWKATDNELDDLLHFVAPLGFNVLFSPPCSVIIFPYEFIKS